MAPRPTSLRHGFQPCLPQGAAATAGPRAGEPEPLGPPLIHTPPAPAEGEPGSLAHASGARLAEVVPLLQPGSFVRLCDHPDDLPPFQLIQCRGGRCWVRQQAWGGLVQWEVARRRLTTAA